MAFTTVFFLFAVLPASVAGYYFIKLVGNRNEKWGDRILSLIHIYGRQPLKDVKVRQAMNYAFDSKAYCEVVFQGYAKEPTSLFSEAVPYYSEQTPYSLDLEKAKSLMKEAGYEDGFPIDLWVDNTTLEMQGAEFRCV